MRHHFFSSSILSKLLYLISICNFPPPPIPCNSTSSSCIFPTKTLSKLTAAFPIRLCGVTRLASQAAT
nr:hypothetical protein Iba_chr12cCG7380 [Ipomoea batatas]GMD67826.1 hypothetical protein Iba_chr12dCG3270 [Ipomoea batatas]